MTYEPGLVSIVIVNWKSKDFVRKCLQSIAKTCADLRLQVVVVDGGSFDGCGEMLASEFPYVDFVQSKENVGFGRANNLGFERVRGEYLLLLNPDTELHPHALQQLLATLKTYPNAGMVGPRSLNPDGTLQKSSVQALPTPLNQALRSEALMKRFPRSRLWGAQNAYHRTTPSEVEAVSGACMLLRSESFAALKGFHPGYFMYGEDMDLCCRLRRKLHVLVIHEPTALIKHYGGASASTQSSKFSVVQQRIALHTYFRLNHGRATAFAYRLTQFLSALARIAGAAVARVIGRSNPSSPYHFTNDTWLTVMRWTLGRNSTGV